MGGSTTQQMGGPSPWTPYRPPKEKPPKEKKRVSPVTLIERTGYRMIRWRVVYVAEPGQGMNLETLHMTKWGARWRAWWDR